MVQPFVPYSAEMRVHEGLRSWSAWGMQALPPARPHPLSPPASAAKKARSSLPWRGSPSVCSPTCLSHVCLFILFEAEEEDEEEMEKMQNGKDRGKRMDYGFQVVLLSLISSPLGEQFATST